MRYCCYDSLHIADCHTHLGHLFHVPFVLVGNPLGIPNVTLYLNHR